MTAAERGEAGVGQRIAVIGLGNVLQGDDALGPYAVEMLSACCEFPPGVSVLDAGTPGLDLTPYVAGLDALIVIDAVMASGAPGELRAYRREELLAVAPPPRLSPHDPGLRECLLTLELIGKSPPEVLLVGLIPERIGSGVGLSEPVRSGLPALEAAVLAELSRLGVAAKPRREPCEPNLWWEKQP
jgi:hydrogenase maturation protease